jgi:hypothetical protein
MLIFALYILNLNIIYNKILIYLSMYLYYPCKGNLEEFVFFTSTFTFI